MTSGPSTAIDDVRIDLVREIGRETREQDRNRNHVAHVDFPSRIGRRPGMSNARIVASEFVKVLHRVSHTVMRPCGVRRCAKLIAYSSERTFRNSGTSLPDGFEQVHLALDAHPNSI